MDRRFYWLGWQLLLPGVGKRVWQIINYFGGPQNAWQAGEAELLEVPGITPVMAGGLVWRRSKINFEQELEQLHKQRINFITYEDENYPQLLKEIFDPPPVLFVRGSLDKLDYSVALVGTRRATAYGRTAAQRLAAELAEYNVAVVSGMARGIDSAAHRGALSAGGVTVAVLGCGLDVVYPPENGRLMDEIIQNGAVISEFPLGSPPEAWHFPSRNRIISGLSKVVVVVEAAEKSGALITADLALEQGREVMAVPGSIYSKMSKGPLGLLKQGARPVTGAADILNELGLEELFNDVQDRGRHKFKLSPAEQKVYEMLRGDPLHLEELIQRLNFPSQEIMAALMFLEVKGLIKKMPGRMYAAVDSGQQF
ncbi:DNA processing protein [Desulfohalotomaculum tongense]|uniref:DNA-processing protein DprA n=1 Tax=Desulforadius tongensis TaxID=1216062 RepID=UPI001958FF8B|nr:DNA-processing protein DprA [Desulforadius tongensis]MBM7854413.1 DNA processing protein [Desulforadius tongensis]